jgi:hypothetical protein
VFSDAWSARTLKWDIYNAGKNHCSGQMKDPKYRNSRSFMLQVYLRNQAWSEITKIHTIWCAHVISLVVWIDTHWTSLIYMNTSPNQIIRVYQQLRVMPLTEEINKDRGWLQKCPLPTCSFSILPRPIQGINFALPILGILAGFVPSNFMS